MGSALCSCNKDNNNNGNPMVIKGDVVLVDNQPIFNLTQLKKIINILSNPVIRKK